MTFFARLGTCLTRQGKGHPHSPALWLPWSHTGCWPQYPSKHVSSGISRLLGPERLAQDPLFLPLHPKGFEICDERTGRRKGTYISICCLKLLQWTNLSKVLNTTLIPGRGRSTEAALILFSSFLGQMGYRRGRRAKPRHKHQLVPGTWALSRPSFPAPHARLWHNTSSDLKKKKRQRQQKNDKSSLPQNREELVHFKDLKEGKCDKSVVKEETGWHDTGRRGKARSRGTS